MIICMYLSIIILMYIVEVIGKKKIRKFLPIITIIFLMCLMGANTNNPDTIIYENIYNRPSFFIKDIGFGTIVWLFKMFQIPYKYLKMCVSIVGLLLINETIKKYVKDSKLYYLLYFIYPFAYDVVQVRNFLAMSIFIYAIPSLLENSKKAKIKYIFLILLSASMQKTALVYLPIVFLKELNFQKRKNLLLNIIIVISIFVGICRPVLYSFIKFLDMYFADTLTGLSQQLVIITNWGWLTDWFVQFFNFGLIRLVKKSIDNNDIVHKEEIKTRIEFVNIVYTINYYLFVFLPLYVITPTFNRIMRNVFPLNFICFNILLETKCSDNLKRNVIFVSVIYILLVFWVYMILGVPYWDTIIKPIFTQNWIFSY